MTVTIDNFEFDIPQAIQLYKFDQSDKLSPNYHGVSVLKAVDVMIEMPEFYAFIEIKEYAKPEISNMLEHKWMGKWSSTNWLKNNLLHKYRDTFLYRFCENKIDKKIKYICLLNFDSALLSQFKNILKKEIPVGNKNTHRWSKVLLDQLIVTNADGWNRKLTTFGLGTCKHL
ncbi:hypothetical protein [Prevotella sp. kh1p2]|uniref:hypothetical protein n=1 Tax=Prevotella sp. kh1p2 TaxID=1761883 RepID=UPI0008AAC371|nr:hypothetical protein [Prevotella sp. kh1p2]SET11345.1 hypothetical protein SAMN04487825_11482 [Prevotella sp. kh1p2]SNU11813.1 hypothetical protein SAMN06298210_11423 [Prevotellaceae bacterium KH2P17]